MHNNPNFRPELSKKDKEKDKRLYRTYGITLFEFNHKLEVQDGVCWICGKLPESGILCVDHIHAVSKKKFKKLPPEEKKKYVRGLLCHYCNRLIGRIEHRKDAKRVFKFIQEYFRIYQMRGD